MNFFTRTAIQSALLLFCLAAATLLSSDSNLFSIKDVELEKISKIQELTLIDPSTKKKVPVEVYFAKNKLKEATGRELILRDEDKYEDEDLFQYYVTQQKLNSFMRERLESVNLEHSFERSFYLVVLQKETRELLSYTSLLLLEYPSGKKDLTNEYCFSWIKKNFVGKEMIQLIGKSLEKIAREEKCEFIFFFTSKRSLSLHFDSLGFKAYRSAYTASSHEPVYYHIKKVKI